MAKKAASRNNTTLDPSGCLVLLDSSQSARARLSRALAASQELRQYRNTLRAIGELDDRHACPGLQDRLAERAYDAEVAYRVLARDCLDCINLLRDGGNLSRALEQFARRADKGLGPDQLNQLLREAAQKLGSAKELKQLDQESLDEAAGIVDDLGLGISARRDRIVVSAKKDGKEVRREFRTASGPGSLGRVGTRDFFAGPRANGFASIAGASLIPEEDCHSRDPARMSVEHAHEVYGQMLGALATGRELMYRHARKVDEIGHGELEGDDPITAIVVTLIVVGAILIIAGTTIAIGCAEEAFSGDICNYSYILIAFGVMFILGGICVAVGQCEFVVELFVEVPA